jgi:hypothetical protein
MRTMPSPRPPQTKSEPWILKATHSCTEKIYTENYTLLKCTHPWIFTLATLADKIPIPHESNPLRPATAVPVYPSIVNASLTPRTRHMNLVREVVVTTSACVC